MIRRAQSIGVPYFHVAPSTARIMWSVSLALLPGIAAQIYFEGSRWLAVLILAVASAYVIEGLLLALRGRSGKHIIRSLGDGSAALSALLLVLCLPANAPLWLIFCGIAFALICGKQLYGGLGMNPFNPAMVGYAFLLVSFPALMGQHSAESLGFFSIFQEHSQTIDAATAATILDSSRQARIAETALSSLSYDWTKPLLQGLAWTSGGLWLLWKGYADWKISATVLLSALISALIFWGYDSSQFLNPMQQLFSGALIFGAFFIATDPITASTTPLGRLLYATLIGSLCIAIRNLGNFPDGFAFAVLLANACVPILDNLSPRYR